MPEYRTRLIAHPDWDAAESKLTNSRLWTLAGTPSPPTKRETIGNLLRGIEIDPTAKDGQTPARMRFSGEVGPIAVRVQKTLKQPISAEATVQVGKGTVRVGRDESGRFIHANQRVRGADIDAGYDAQRGAYVSGKKSVGWGK